MKSRNHEQQDNDLWAARFNPNQSSLINTEREVRTPWERDYARLIHSSAFRRMQSKTQVLGLGESDFYRTRLTHSLEVAQIGVGIVRWLEQKLQRSDFLYTDIEKQQGEKLIEFLPDYELMNAICLAHDIGHPPFGHGGEVALNICMRDYGGFEGNGQSLRILSRLDKYTKDHGMNPTRRLLLGVLKYPLAYSQTVNHKAYGKLEAPLWRSKASEQLPPKCFLDTEQEIVDWILEPLGEEERSAFISAFDPSSKTKQKHLNTRYKSFDTSIMELADDISYGLHDLEDAISLGLITRDIWRTHFANKNHLFAALCQNVAVSSELDKKAQDVEDNLFSLESYQRKHQIGRLVHSCISNIFIDTTGIACAKEPLIKYNAFLAEEQKALLKHISKLVMDKVILSPNVQQLEFKGQKIVIELFDTLSSDPLRLLPESHKERYKTVAAESANDGIKLKRVICDFIAGMTDEYAARFYERIYHPHEGSVFDRM